MTYLSQESSKTSGKPVFLYEFVQGSLSWFFNSSADTIIWNTKTWLPNSISHSDVTQSNELSKDNLSLKFSRLDTFANQFMGYAPDQVTSIIIRRGHINDGEFVVYWRGRVVGSKASNNTIDIECESIFTSLRRPGLRARYQRTCRHALYSSGCNLSKDSFVSTGLVSALSGATITVPAIAGADAGWWLGGIVGYGVNLRLISGHSGGVITMSRPIDALSDAFALYGSNSQTVSIYPGCDRTRGTCGSKFANSLNFGGFPWIPTKNPLGGSSIV